MRFDVTEACTNGHKITGVYGNQPHRHEAFCRDCGAATISAYPSYEMAIMGDKHFDRGQVISIAIPKFCIYCGKEFPWQVAALVHLKALFSESELDESNQAALESSLPNIIRDTFMTESASLRVKKILGKIGKPVYDVAITEIADVASETAKKALGLEQ
jgi:hypothetical protein